MINELRRLIKREIEDAAGIPAYSFRSNDDAVYPYAVFTIDGVASQSFAISRYRLTVEVWAQGNPYEAYNLAESIAAHFKQFCKNDEEITVHITEETPFGMLDDPDKTLVRLSGSYDVMCVSRKEN